MTKMSFKQGSFCWHEMHSTDTKKSAGFYTSLNGWTANEMKMGGEAVYTIFSNGDNGIAGMMQHMGEISGQGSNWLTYVYVDDVDNAASTAQSIGGKIITQPADIPNIGRYSILEDLEGVRIAVIRLADNEKLPDEKTGYFCWNEFMTRDLEKARKFYETIFGWKIKEASIPGAGPYNLLMNGEEEVGGLMQVSEECGDHPACWTNYILVNDIEKESARMVELGGKSVAGPDLIPGVGYYTIFKDPAGATSALYQTLKK
jgi:uncharacterized protein